MSTAVPIVIAIITALAGFLTWLFQRRSERIQTERLRKEALYEKLLEAITEISSFGDGAPLLIESQKAWLYASDDVLRAVNSYLKVFLDEEKNRKNSGELNQEARANRQQREGVIRLAIRRDLHKNTMLDEQWLSNEWRPVAAPEQKIRDYFVRRGNSSK